jgi:predicted MPP superfamily phosphohydrolase
MVVDFPFGGIVAASMLLDGLALVAGVTGLRGLSAPAGETRIGLPALLRGLLAMGLVFAAKLALLVPRGLDRFGLIHLLFVNLVVVLPACGVLLLLGRATGRLRPSAIVTWLAGLSLGLATVGAYASLVEPFRLRLELPRLALDPGRAGHEPLRIAVLSDLQTDRVTAYERGAVDRLLALRPDVILLPGDVFQGTGRQFEAELPRLRALLGRLDAPGGVYLVGGDVDHPEDRLPRLVQGTRIRLLDNQVARVQVRDRRLAIAGLELGYFSRDARDTLARLEQADDPGEIRIVLAHRPDVVLDLPRTTRIDLVVSGHTHGGQIVVPGFGPPMTLSHVPRRVAAGGLHRLDGRTIYVSRGVGCERGQAPRMRFLCPPELTLLELWN